MTPSVIREEWPDFEIFYGLANELGVTLGLERSIYRPDASRMHPVTKQVPIFFRLLERELDLSIIRQLAALFDQPRVGRNSNITVGLILEEGSMRMSPSAKRRCDELLDGIGSSLEKLRRFRNKHVAHYDRDSFDRKENSAVLRRKDVWDMTDALFEIIEVISVDVFSAGTTRGRVIGGTAMDLLEVLGTAAWHEELRRLFRNEDIGEQELAGFMRERPDWKNSKWRIWCEARNLDFRYYLAK